MSYTNIWVHIVWSTKYRLPLLTDEIRQKVFCHMRSNARKKGVYIDHVNGWFDHVHCLISLGSNQKVAKVVQLIKGESAFWINKQQLTESYFSWQREYFAASVSINDLPKLRAYIRNQASHHRTVQFHEEYNRLLSKHKEVASELERQRYAKWPGQHPAFLYYSALASC